MFRFKVTKPIAPKLFDTQGFKKGDYVEFLYDGDWLLGQIKESEHDGELRVWELGTFKYKNLGECKIHQSASTIQNAKCYLKDRIDHYEDIINHTLEKKMISEYRYEINNLPDIKDA